MEDTKLLVSGAGASQEKLAQAAQSSVITITKLADVVKLGAASLGSEDPETQVGHRHSHCTSPFICLVACVLSIYLLNTKCTTRLVYNFLSLHRPTLGALCFHRTFNPRILYVGYVVFIIGLSND